MGLTRQEILDLQRLPLNKKIELSKEKIKEWYEYWEGSVYISFSGGKDSTVLSHLYGGLFNENKFQILQRLHPKKYDYCMNKLGLKKILPQIGVNYF